MFPPKYYTEKKDNNSFFFVCDILHYFQIQINVLNLDVYTEIQISDFSITHFSRLWLRFVRSLRNMFLCNVISSSLHILVQCLKEKSKIIPFSSLFIYGCVFSVCIVAARCE